MMNLLRSPHCLLLLITLLTTLASSGLAGKILVFPVDGSHWINMKLLIEDLHHRGHEVSVVRTSTSWYVKEDSPHYKSITVTLPEPVSIEDQDYFVSFLNKMLKIQKSGGSPLAIMQFYWQMLTALSQIHKEASQMAVEMFENPVLMQQLHEARYDVALIDPGLPAGVLVAHKLGLPTVFNVRWITSGEAHSVVAPSPASYVPASGSALPTRMSFIERVKNMLHYLLNACMDQYSVFPVYQELATRYFGPETSFKDMLQATDIWLIRSDFVFEFPRPIMPNFVHIGGFQCKPSKPLPADLEEFVQGSGEHGVVVMSLGTLVKGLPTEITSEIAAGFARLPQRVIWRHLGERPQNLGNNTRLVEWLPQNDLLGHPKTRAFVAHGGANGVYESIYHGIPVVGLPLLFDQFENILRLEIRGAAKALEVTKLDSQSFYAALQDVLHRPSYKDNMMRLSRIHHDKPAHPRDSAIYWIEFVMRHKGAAHLRTESYKMPWYSYHSLDVLAFLLLLVLTVGGAVIFTTCFLCIRLCRTQKSKLE
ncbi:UDP-glucuronosyltransferase 2C1-like [Triplophysa dalaica]|uniref:UDP-glucuronosyltransferase 2C1-like n=1 Tax=Triplophysa dalaica TaxID=1582913 RepID=UPI0024E009FC|nr:UDP-glucuronosyltransferase 2C1-like [Triplophysa dalaica]